MAFSSDFFIETFWLIRDGDFYVSSSGSDTEGTGDPSNPFATIQKATDEATVGQKIVIGSGLYEENVDGAGKSLLYFGDGTVISNGSSVGGTAFTNLGASAIIDSLIITDYTNAIDSVVSKVSKSRIINNDIVNFGGELRNVIVKASDVKATLATTVYSCTFIGTVSGDTGTSDNLFTEVFDCHFDSASDFKFDTTQLNNLDYCNQETGSSISIDGVSYTDSSSLNAAHSGFQPNGLSILPQFNNVGIDDYSLEQSSSLVNTGRFYQQIGACGIGFSYDPTDAGFFSTTNVSVNGSAFQVDDNYELGTVESGVIDLGEVRALGKINLFSDDLFAGAPSGIYPNDDAVGTHSNVVGFEMRFSTTDNILNGESYKAFIAEKIPTIDVSGFGNGDVDFDTTDQELVVAQFVQIRIILRTNTLFLVQENDDCLLQENDDKLIWKY